MIGALAVIYARGRADGERDHEMKRLKDVTDKNTARIDSSEARIAATDRNLAVLAERVEAHAEVSRDTNRLVRKLVSGGGNA